MMRGFLVTLLTLIFGALSCAHGQDEPDFSDAAFEEQTGFFDVQVNSKTHQVYAVLPAADEDGMILRMIHTAALTAGLGSNPIGLDRGWWQEGNIMAFRRMGDTVIVEIENLDYRANPSNPLEERAVAESFATSFIASMPVVAESANTLTVDLTPFLTSDYLGLVQYLKDAKQGSFSVASDRTFVDTDQVLVFPDNVEIDAFITLTSADAEREVTTTTAKDGIVTLTQHHSFVRLPEDGYEPMEGDPRTGAITVPYYDYSAPLGEPIEKRMVRRFRLQKDADGNTINPIVFYIDPGAPEPIRSALVDGAKWWADAFAAAGFPDGYKVELLPEDAHPLDIRYNVVQWVHRQTRGWSYGGGVADPRTGEMLKGHVILGSLRVRQDIMIFEGLAGTSKSGTGAADDPIEIALARIRQLSAHEIGHSLGFQHNFAASTYNKGSVMDYPAPDIRVSEGQLDFSQAYGVGVGPWDAFAAAWLYGDMTDDERDALVQRSISDGLVFVDDGHARSPATGHPLGNIWDNGADPVEGLREAMAVRRIALDNFGEDSLKPGQPRSDLNSVIVPIYLFHRYQTAAAAKKIGGMSFNYSVVGDGQSDGEVVPVSEQREALSELLKTVSPAELDLSDDVLALLTPSIDSWMAADPQRELFNRTAYPAFDTVTAADTAAEMTFGILLEPQRVARLIEFRRRDPSQMGAAEFFSTIRTSVMSQIRSERYQAIAEAVRARYAFSLMDLANAKTTTAVKSAAAMGLADLKTVLERDGSAHSDWLVEQITAFESRAIEPAPPTTPAKPLPPGGPIGSSGMGIYETGWFED